MPFSKFWKFFRSSDKSEPDPGLPKNFGDVWTIVQEVAREEQPEVFEKKTVTDHATENLEGKKDVDRWLHAYLKRLSPDHDFEFPVHHRRHRGYCLMPRHWPNGTRWEAYDEKTLLKAGAEGQDSRDALIEVLDAWLDGVTETEAETDEREGEAPSEPSKL